MQEFKQKNIWLILKGKNERHNKNFQHLEDSNNSLKGDSKTIENEMKEQKIGFMGILLRALWASLLGNMLTGEQEQDMEV